MAPRQEMAPPPPVLAPQEGGPAPGGASHSTVPRTPPRSASALPTSKETRPKGSPSAAMSKNTVGLTMAAGSDEKGQRRLQSGTSLAAPLLLYTAWAPPTALSRAWTLINRNCFPDGVTARAAYGRTRARGGAGSEVRVRRRARRQVPARGLLPSGCGAVGGG
uniref:uncharacterized protein LOC125410372 n=1 Tax=Myodes glareolus TaxID=447135 RepID=UPI0020203199|nr:uncharacterized protein LOC125410372 [Myodes glareolus]